MLKSLAAALGLLMLASVNSAAADKAIDLPGTERSAIRQTIERQMQAFSQDDGEAAFAYAAPNIRQLFRTADNFMAMVRGGYPQVYRPREVEFRKLVEYEGLPAQQVFVVGPDGKPAIALYVMERQADGGWLIAGCYLLPAPDLSA